MPCSGQARPSIVSGWRQINTGLPKLLTESRSDGASTGAHEGGSEGTDGCDTAEWHLEKELEEFLVVDERLGL
jgi:hypothetical protein